LDNWNDSECVTILRNCFNALPASGKVIAAESVLPDLVQSKVGAGTQAALRIDVSAMMFNAVGAKERTLHEFRKLAKAAGFASVSVVATVDFLSVLEFKKV
jgi:caffeic acid 3-O-methyltransferase